jgi:hypothetical protein
MVDRHEELKVLRQNRAGAGDPDIIARGKALHAELLQEARSKLVAKYRTNPAPWPDGVDTKYDRWYRPEEWTDTGAYLGKTNN